MITHDFKYCPLCGADLGYLRGETENIPRCDKCGKVFYPAPHPTANAIIVDDKGKVLLTRRKYEPMKGYWDVPGGFLDIGESIEDGLRREIREELDIEIEIGELIGTFPGTYGEQGIPTINMFYFARITGGIPRAGSDVAGFEWFPSGKIPEQIAFENGRKALEKWLEQEHNKKKKAGDEQEN